MLERAHTEIDPGLALQVEAVRAKFKKKIDRTYASYAGSHGKRTWHETVAVAGRQERACEAEVNAILASPGVSSLEPDASDQSAERTAADEADPALDSKGESEGNGLGEQPADPVRSGSGSALGSALGSGAAVEATSGTSSGIGSGTTEKVERKKRGKNRAKIRATDEAIAPVDGDGDALVAPAPVSAVVSLRDEALQPAKLVEAANKLVRELVVNYRRAVHQAVQTGKLANPPGPLATKDQHKEAVHILFNLWMTRSIEAQDAASAKIAEWEKSLTGALHVQLQSLTFGARAAERERLSEPYDTAFRRVRIEKLRITPIVQREHDQFQATLQSALRKRVAAIDADVAIPSDRKKGRKAVEDEEELAVV